MSKNEDALKAALLLLDKTLGEQLLADLKDSELRGPQLYSAIDKYLNRHKFHIDALTPDEDVLGGLTVSLDAFKQMREQEKEDERMYG